MDVSSECYEERHMNFLSILKVILTDVKPEMLIAHQKEIHGEYLIAAIVDGLNNQYLCN